jgi:hypothetical protein
VNGHCTTTALTVASRAAVTSAWPPPNDVPHSATRWGSTPRSSRAYRSAEHQSCSWRADAQELPRPPRAIAEMPVSERQAGYPRGGKALGEPHLARRGETVAHYHHRRQGDARRTQQGGGTGPVPGPESQLLTLPRPGLLDPPGCSDGLHRIPGVGYWYARLTAASRRLSGGA